MFVADRLTILSRSGNLRIYQSFQTLRMSRSMLPQKSRQSILTWVVLVSNNMRRLVSTLSRRYWKPKRTKNLRAWLCALGPAQNSTRPTTLLSTCIRISPGTPFPIHAWPIYWLEVLVLNNSPPRARSDNWWVIALLDQCVEHAIYRKILDLCYIDQDWIRCSSLDIT